MYDTTAHGERVKAARVKLFDLAARQASVQEETERAIHDVLATGVFVGGPWVAKAEALCAGWTGCRDAVGVNSGTDALMLALQSLDIGTGDEVIVPALSFYATASAVLMTGATPIVVDVNDDALMDPRAVLEALSSNTRAVVPVHLFGAPAPRLDVGDIPIVDDAAQAIGANLTGRKGRITTVSCYPTKPWGAAGDAGFVCSDDPEQIANVRRLANHGTTGPHQHTRIGQHIGRNSRLDAMQAAYLVAQSPTVMPRLQRRRDIAARYDVGLPAEVRPLRRGEGSALHHYVVRAPRRDAVAQALRDADIDSAVYYPRPLNEQPALQHIQGPPTPNAKRLTDELLALPSHAFLTDEDVDRVLDVLHNVVR